MKLEILTDVDSLIHPHENSPGRPKLVSVLGSFPLRKSLRFESYCWFDIFLGKVFYIISKELHPSKFINLFGERWTFNELFLEYAVSVSWKSFQEFNWLFKVIRLRLNRTQCKSKLSQGNALLFFFALLYSNSRNGATPSFFHKCATFPIDLVWTAAKRCQRLKHRWERLPKTHKIAFTGEVLHIYGRVA